TWIGQGFLSAAVVAQTIVVTLAVNAAPQTAFGKNFIFEFAGLLELELAFVRIDFIGEMRRDLGPELFLPARHPLLLPENAAPRTSAAVQPRFHYDFI